MVVGVAAGNITAEIAQNNKFLANIIDALRNPLATAADERYRRGVSALAKSWYPEAIADLSESVVANPYFPPAHAALGIAKTNHGDGEGALASFRLAVRYATPDEPQIATGCALLAASLLESLHRPKEAAELLRPMVATYRNCPEVALTYARISGDEAPVRWALWLAPELAIAAVAAQIPGAREAASALAADPAGPIADAVAIRKLSAGLSPLIYEASMPQLPQRISAIENEDTPSAMAIAGLIFNDARGLLREVNAISGQARASDTARERSHVEAKSAWEAAVHTAPSGGKVFFWALLSIVTVGAALAALFGGWAGQAAEPTAVGIGVVFTIIAILVFVFTGLPCLAKLAGAVSDVRKSNHDVGVRLARIEEQAPLSSPEIEKRKQITEEITSTLAPRIDRLVPWSAN